MRDPRYDTVKGLLKEGAIEKFSDIFRWIPPTVVAAGFGTNHDRMKKMVADPSPWSLGELYQLADWIGYDPKKVQKMKKG